jgi:hypothetical protein
MSLLWLQDSSVEFKNPYNCSPNQFRKIKSELEQHAYNDWESNIFERLQKRRNIINQVLTQQ